MRTRIGLSVAAAIFVLAACGQSSAEPVLCPPQDDLYSIPAGTWHADYSGYLTAVRVDRRPSGTVVSCARQIGQKTAYFEKSCRLMAGASHSPPEVTADGTACSLSSSTEKTNDRECLISCEAQ
jgi:hypothetical protein